MQSLLYLSAADVQACGVTPAEMNAAVEQAFLQAARNEAATRPVMSIPGEGRAAFRAKGGYLGGAGYGAVKWYGYFPGNLAAGLPEYRPLILLNEAQHGVPVAIMNGDWITAVRTASITAVGAKYLAPPGATRLCCIGCGVQARASLETLLPYFPLASVRAHSRRRESAEAFARFVRDHGLAATTHEDPREALDGAEIVVTSVPRLSTRVHFLDSAWLAPGGFASMVDSGVSWRDDTLPGFDRFFTDDVGQAEAHLEPGDAAITFDASLAEIIGGARPGRRTAPERIALLFSGTGLADVAAAVAVYERARAMGIGQTLPL